MCSQKNWQSKEKGLKLIHYFSLHIQSVILNGQKKPTEHMDIVLYI